MLSVVFFGGEVVLFSLSFFSSGVFLGFFFV